MPNETQTPMHRCPVCMYPHERINQAIECCLEPEAELSTADLEAIGQQRLFD